MPEQNRATYYLFALLWRNRADLTARRDDFGALYNWRTAIFIQHRHERFADRELSKHRLNFELWILPESFRGSFHCLLIAWRKRAQGVLRTIPELSENNLGNIQRILADKI